jgi:hypothetical protein
MNQETHDKYFKNIDYNTNIDVNWNVLNKDGADIKSAPNYVTGMFITI